MTVFLTITLVALFVLAAVTVVRRGGLNKLQPTKAKARIRDRRPQDSAAVKRPRKSTKYHSVTIELDPHPCAAVKAIGGAKLLSHEAPILPVSECDQANCRCRYIHHDDRRGWIRRGYESALGQIAALGAPKDRRSARGRRENDLAEQE